MDIRSNADSYAVFKRPQDPDQVIELAVGIMAATRVESAGSSVHVGDYLIQHADGTAATLDRETFERDYYTLSQCIIDAATENNSQAQGYLKTLYVHPKSRPHVDTLIENLKHSEAFQNFTPEFEKLEAYLEGERAAVCVQHAAGRE